VADLNRFDEYAARYLYDGQTGEMLAWCKKEKGDLTGFIFNGKSKRTRTGMLPLRLTLKWRVIENSRAYPA
jgi:hypothetical protein